MWSSRPVCDQGGRNVASVAGAGRDVHCQLANQLGKYTQAGRCSPTAPCAPVLAEPVSRGSGSVLLTRRRGGAPVPVTGYINVVAAGVWRTGSARHRDQRDDRMDQLSRVTLQSPIRQETTQDDPQWWWPLTEAAGSTSAMEQSGNGGPPLGLTGSVPR